MESHINNRYSARMTTRWDKPTCPVRGTVFMAHGMAGYKEQAPMQAVKKAALYAGYQVVTADFTNGFGDADGSLSELTMSRHISDFEDVIAWIREQDDFKEPFVIGGHSIGNLAALEVLHRQKGEGFAGVIALSPNLAGKLRQQAFEKYQPQAIVRFNEKGYLNIKDPETGKHGKLVKDYIDDFLSYDMRDHAKEYTTPMLLITGLDDVITPPEHVREFVSMAENCHLTYNEIYGADHFWRDQIQQDSVSLHVEEWLEKVI